VTEWRPAPPDEDPATLRKGIDAVLALIDQHSDKAARFVVHAKEAEANADRLCAEGKAEEATAERERAARARRTVREYLGAADQIIEALVTAWDLWPEYTAAVDGDAETADDR
jgi:3-hydroxyacyl-CoA dehydrogenase